MLGGSELFCGDFFRAFNSAASNSRMMACASAGWRAIIFSVMSSRDLPYLSRKMPALTRSFTQPNNPQSVNGYGAREHENWADTAYKAAIIVTFAAMICGCFVLVQVQRSTASCLFRNLAC